MPKNFLILCLFVSTFVGSGRGAADESSSGWDLSARGFLMTRGQFYALDDHATLSHILPVEPFRVMHEGNLVAQAGWGESLFLMSDVSALLRIVPEGCAPGSSDPGCIVVNELYAEWRPWSFLRLLAGRHRVSWGNAFTFQLVETLNARPDLTEPTAQRLGVWMGLAEGTFGDWVGSLQLAPDITHAPFGYPNNIAFLYGHLAGRLLWRGPSVDAMALVDWDYGLGRLVGGLQATAFPVAGLELHGQLIVHNRREIQTGSLEKDSCRGLSDIGIPHRDVLDFSSIAGARYDFDDGSMVALEHMHNGDGITAPDYLTTLTTIDLIKVQCPNARMTSPDASKVGRPTPFSNVLLGREYIFLTALRPSIASIGMFENMGIVGTLQWSLDDLSVATNVRLTWTYQQATQFRVGAFVPLGVDKSQLGILPFDGFVTAEVQTNF